ncbi:transketolase C-terminal domain-containing protein [Dolichospermum circinale]|uniref:transketolase C-terminal domain-containing protein n=1 Tax=Dolichospermum circinale TaxID=109265 RepID=UPI00041BD705|nr:transketolase C-terminal domain-containing protein [Dolichospermum circinale]MDB9475044.1 transketolase C-terminal domain-containing protein [Dolichospermum circinale CS-537/11]MDB9480058.1 transketolase C-terminal domain-containing protein [Dolichospermum circinale CS-537/03]
MTTSTLRFPIDLDAYKPLKLNPAHATLTDEQREILKANIQLCRDTIVFFTAIAAAKGVGGHTGGAYDTVPEVMILDAFFRGSPDKFVPIFFDEAGHRVATQYLMATLHGDLDAENLLHYREPNFELFGHPERGRTPGIKFSAGRLGHLWPYVNGVAIAHPNQVVFCLGSDGSQQEGNDAEAARLAVAKNLNVKLIIDDNNSTCSGYPSDYLPGFNVSQTLAGHGLKVLIGAGEDIDDLYSRLCQAVNTDGPIAVINKRPMTPGIVGVEGTPLGHDALSPDLAIAYLETRGHTQAVEYLKQIIPLQHTYTFNGSSSKTRHIFDATVVSILSSMTPAERQEKVMCIDSDLGESCGINKIRQAYPEIFYHGGIMERGNFSAAAGFGMQEGKQGIFSTYSAFLEMCISEITMARLNKSNILCQFSHSGIDELGDNTCHFGLNNMFADNGLEDGYQTRLYYPADGHQMKACVETIFYQPGLRFLFSSRSPVPDVLDTNGKPLFAENYTFIPGKDDIVREGTAGYIVSFGEVLYRALDAVENLKQQGIDVGLINKSTLNLVDEEIMAKIGKTSFVLVVESLNRRTGLGIRFGSWLLERGFSPKYAYMGTHKEGCSGIWEQLPHQGIDTINIINKVKEILK